MLLHESHALACGVWIIHSNFMWLLFLFNNSINSIQFNQFNSIQSIFVQSIQFNQFKNSINPIQFNSNNSIIQLFNHLCSLCSVPICTTSVVLHPFADGTCVTHEIMPFVIRRSLQVTYRYTNSPLHIGLPIALTQVTNLSGVPIPCHSSAGRCL